MPTARIIPSPVHPRSCGEHVGNLGLIYIRTRFIPARAGNTSIVMVPSSTWTVHPRSCGEHVISFAKASRFCGSSPLVRGTLGFLDGQDHMQRFIPARAGNTHSVHPVTALRTVHPRSCGEHITFELHPGGFVGSSPLVRGTPQACLVCFNWIRFIPARAGNTADVGDFNSSFSVHPRSCGEHSDLCPIIPVPAGSSPLVRGTQRKGIHNEKLYRFIPARAGNTPQRKIQVFLILVHPRSCGEHITPIFAG